MSDQIQNILIIAAALTIVVALALVFKRQLFIRWGKDKVIKTGGGDRPVQNAVATGAGAIIENSSQTAKSAASTQDIRAQSGGQVKGVKQNISTDKN